MVPKSQLAQQMHIWDWLEQVFLDIKVLNSIVLAVKIIPNLFDFMLGTVSKYWHTSI